MIKSAYVSVLLLLFTFVSAFAGESLNMALGQSQDLLDDDRVYIPHSSQIPLSEEDLLEEDEFFVESGIHSDYSGDDMERDRKVVTAMDKSLAAIYGIITIIGLLSNCVVFFVIFGRNEISRTVTAIYVVQLALADSVFLLSLPMFIMQKAIGSWTFGSVTCTIGQTIKFLNYYAGIFFLTAMSVDRYIAVAFSTTANQLRTKKTTYIVCVIVWTLSAVMTLPIAIFAKTEDVFGTSFCRLQFPGYPMVNDEDTVIIYSEPKYFDSATNNDTLQQHNLTESWEFENDDANYDDEIYSSEAMDKGFECMHESNYTSLKNWLIANFVIGFLIPFLIISTSYFLILKRLRLSEDKLGATKKSGRRTAIVRKRVTRTVAALVICFVICWLPYHLFRLSKIQGFKASVLVCKGIEEYLVALGFSNSALNPILYTFMGHNFMERFRESVDITRRRLRRGSMASMAGHVTKSHSDHGGTTTFARKVSNIVGFRRTSKIPTDQEADPQNRRFSREHQNGKKSKYGVPLLTFSKRKQNKSGWECATKQKDRSECTSRTHSNQTEWTKVLLDKDTKYNDTNISL